MENGIIGKVVFGKEVGAMKYIKVMWEYVINRIIIGIMVHFRGARCGISRI